MATSFKDRGNEAYQAGEYETAVHLYTEGIQEEPTNAALFSNRSAAYLKLQDYSKARFDADICIELDVKWSKGWWRKGTAQLEDQDYKGAKQTFTTGLEHCPDDKNLLNGVHKADKFIAAVESVQGPGELDAEFDPDGPSQKSPDPVDTNMDESRGVGTEEKPNESDSTWPGSAEEEIQRIKNAPNHYAILHVSTDTSNAEMKKNYYTLARMLHPDKCQLEGADDAMTAVSQAYDTLTNVIKKTLYDQYLSQVGNDADNPNQTYQEWESRQQPVDLPVWLRWLLEIKGCGWILAIIVVLVCLPIVILVFFLVLIVYILTLPYRIVLSCCFPEKYKAMKEQHEREMAKMEEEAQDRAFAHV